MNLAEKIMATAVTDKTKERRDRVFLGPLPDDFLRITESVQQQQEAVDRQTALALQQQLIGHQTYVPNVVGRLSITVVQAKLTKNYGMTRMDPYARIRVGHNVFETHTDQNGGKMPRWNKVVQCLLPQGVNAISMEIYDERSFTMDELIAWTQITIPKQVMQGETHEDWYSLTGKQGEGVEGLINLVLSFVPGTHFRQGQVLLQPNAQAYVPYQQPIMMVPNVGGARGPTPMAVYAAPPTVQAAAAPAPVVPVLSESELKQIEEMFPNIDKEVIKSVFDANRGNKAGTVNSLLQMCE